MNENEIERILHLQETAYELLLWLNKRAVHEPEILSDANLEKWRFAESCENWVRDVRGMIPQSLRPDESDIPAFARLFSSFFQTSFRVVEDAPTRVHRTWVASGKRKLIPGAPSGKKSAKGKAKVEESAHELRLIALEELSIENDLDLSRAQLEEVERDEKLDAALTLWTYFHELNRRANFASQGEAVRALWLAMDKKKRGNINAEKVLKALESLSTALQSV